ncbi:MAG: hypothetical protein CSA25_03125 [Desulfobacter postgatei]|uniref:Uncharacterized protein n=1 Tax=Desulfobacter postgatei TaxID=2293 RepID=A0A2G6MS46_9BACT|nr:MAG: hypothetical protein CSA25_03125 [Desulfobacter postgatei]
MKMRTNFYKFSVNSRTIDTKLGGIGVIFMGLQPIHQLSNRLLGKPQLNPTEKAKRKPTH